jgi:hypothetical protein
MNLRKEVPIMGAAGEGAKGKVSGQIFCEQQLMDDTISPHESSPQNSKLVAHP